MSITATMDKKTIKVSLAGRLKHPVSAEWLAKEIGAPLLLVQEVLRAECRKKGAKIISVGTKTEDGEMRVMFQAKEDAINGGRNRLGLKIFND